jgi:ankyrin repeat protein
MYLSHFSFPVNTFDKFLMQELGKYPVHVAAEVGSLDCLRLLLEAGSGDVNAVNKAGRSALHMAVERGDVDMVDYLLKARGIDLDLKDKRGC